jgi:Ricin-type beta-trefoil lectin domain
MMRRLVGLAAALTIGFLASAGQAAAVEDAAQDYSMQFQNVQVEGYLGHIFYDNADHVDTGPSNGGRELTWVISPVADGAYLLKIAEKCLDAAGAPGTEVSMTSCNTHDPSQQWYLRPITSEHLVIEAAHVPDRVLTSQGGIGGFEPVLGSAYDGSDSQRWVIS